MNDRPDSNSDVQHAKATGAEGGPWIRQFVQQLERRVLDANRSLSSEASISQLQAATARAVVATYLDSGLELESIVELLGQAAVESKSAGGAWSDDLNQRRFTLIDKEIQGPLTAVESIELAGLTKMMRDYVESETNLPMEGARALHRKLLQLQATGETD